MAAVYAEQWSVTVEQRKDFVALQRDERGFWESLGAVFRVRNVLVAGEGSGLITVYHFYPDATTRAVALDESAAAADRHPLTRAMSGGNVPGTLVGRLFLNSVDPAASIPAEYAVAALTAYEVPPARAAAAEAAFDAADKRERGLGVEPALWATIYAGAATGRRLRVIGHASYAALADFTQRNVALGAPDPLEVAAADGILRVASTAITTPLAGM